MCSKRMPRPGRPFSTTALRVFTIISPPGTISFAVLVPTGISSAISVNSTPPSVVDFLFNTAEAEFETAQVNAAYHVHQIHEFFKSRLPDYEGLDKPLDCFVNIASTCNANYFPLNGGSLNFFQQGTFDNGTEILVCPNSAYSSIIA